MGVIFLSPLQCFYWSLTYIQRIPALQGQAHECSQLDTPRRWPPDQETEREQPRRPSCIPVFPVVTAILPPTSVGGLCLFHLRITGFILRLILSLIIFVKSILLHRVDSHCCTIFIVQVYHRSFIHSNVKGPLEMFSLALSPLHWRWAPGVPVSL